MPADYIMKQENNFKSRYARSRECGRIDKNHYFYGEWVITGDQTGYYQKSIISVGESGVTHEHLDILQSFDNAEAQDQEDDARYFETMCENFHEFSSSIEDDLFMDIEPQNELLQRFKGKVLPNLSEEQFYILYEHMVNGKSLKELANEFGVTYQAIQNRLIKIMDKIRKLMD